ncbi:MAG: PEGA domain-containing protein [Kiritimatiellia bacterium]
MIRRWLAIIVALVALAGGTAEETRSARVDFTSRPEGADVVIDGILRGRTPLTLYDLMPGEHHVRYAMGDYEERDLFIRVEPGYAIHNAELEAVRGLLLVTSEPTGCDVSLDGLSLGETPRLITTLESKSAYRLLLQKPGYQPRTVEVRFNGRTPLFRHEKLILDSGILEISSEPAGAEVSVNGIARGRTPVIVRDIPKGRATVQLTRRGYAEVVRELSLNAGDRQTLFLKLEGNPGTLRLTSVPENARFYLNGVTQGKGPVTLGNLAPGAYTVRAELDGYGTVERTVNIGIGQTVDEEFRLENILGRLEIRTKPVGAQVFVDGRACGVTRAADATSDVSEVLMVPNLKAGEHTVVIKKHGYAEVVRRPTLEASRATPLDIRLKRVFTPDIEIETSTGVYRGVLVENGISALVIEVSMGVNRTFPRADIRNITLLNATP